MKPRILERSSQIPNMFPNPRGQSKLKSTVIGRLASENHGETLTPMDHKEQFPIFTFMENKISYNHVSREYPCTTLLDYVCKFEFP